MHTLLIVDDEKAPREGLKTIVDWAALGIEVVGEADDGQSALPLILEKKPNILLTDVKMPIMDGLSLASRACALLPNLKVVFISGYDDAQYLRSAFKVGAYDYLLKPIDLSDLNACMRRVTGRLDNEIQQGAYLSELSEQTTLSMPVMKERHLTALLMGELCDEALDKSQLNRYDIRFAGDRFAVMVVVPDEMEMKRQPERAADIQRGILSICGAATNATSVGYVIRDPMDERRFAILLSLYSGTSCDLYELADSIRLSVRRRLSIPVTVGIGEEVHSVKEMRKSYLQACHALKHRLYLDDPEILSSTAPVAERGTEKAALPNADELRELLIGDSDDMLREWMSVYFKRLSDLKLTDIGYYRGKVCVLIYVIYTVLSGQMAGTDEYELSQQAILENLYGMMTLNQMRKLIENYAMDAHSLIRLKDDRKVKGEIRRVMAIIEERFHENLTINDLARQVYLTPTYLCMLFHQEVGMTINNYLTEVRMERAKKLLIDEKNKLYDVSYAVGYMNPSYFSRQFKKATGFSPSEYRQRAMKRV